MWWACPSYSGCDSEIEFPLDVGCKRQGVKLNFEDIESTTIDLIPYGILPIDLIPYGTGLETAIFIPLCSLCRM